MKIIIASRHGYKIRETKNFLKQIGDFDIFSLLDFPDYIAPEEPLTSTEEHATLKGYHAAKHLQEWVIADDSMLLVPALQGSPGAYSKNFYTENPSEKNNRQHLLHLMQSFEGDVSRAAYFECSVALVSPDGKLFSAKSICEGYLAEKEKGGNGFGYDSLFLKHNYKQTFAELSEETKNQISHRAKALQKLIPSLLSLVQPATL